MSQKRPPEDSKAPFAQRIDPKKEPLNQDQASYIRRAELAQWQNKFKKMRARNILTGLSIGAMVMGICILSPSGCPIIRCERLTCTIVVSSRNGDGMAACGRLVD
ncbi:COA3 factor, partial [Polypterus senegalus]|nr:COA3 factor [Polypterus senegalus]